MAFHRLVVVASLPATFPTLLGRVNRASCVNPGTHRAANPYEVSMGGSPLSGLVGGLAKARQVLDLTRK